MVTTFLISLLCAVVAAIVSGIVVGLAIGKEAIGAELAGGMGGLYGFLGGGAAALIGLTVLSFI